MERRKKYLILAVILLLAGIVCAVWLGNYMYSRTMEAEKWDQLRQDASVTETSSETDAQESSAAQETSAEEAGAEVYVDFQELWKRNPDIYAWIVIPDTRVDYPILQNPGQHQDYYLMHDVDRNVSASGSIYTETLNSKDFTDPNTVIYGHNMRNGTMFRDLHLFQEKEFFDQHPYVYIYTPNGMLTYEIFSAYEYDNRHILKSFDFSDPEVYAAYLEEATHPRSVNVMTREGLTVTNQDRIITLSTCIGKDTSRYLVQAVLMKEERYASDDLAWEDPSAETPSAEDPSTEDLSSEEALN